MSEFRKFPLLFRQIIQKLGNGGKYRTGKFPHSKRSKSLSFIEVREQRRVVLPFINNILRMHARHREGTKRGIQVIWLTPMVRISK
jgi:hypothetical protein